MKNNFKLGVIGAGFMSTAIIKGIISSKRLKPNQIICSDISEENLSKISKLKIKVTLSNEEVANKSEFILFAVKPQSLKNVFDSIKKCEVDKIITIVAGTKKEKFKKIFKNSKVARCMPNTPCSINSGAIGIDLTDFNSKKDVSFIYSILSPLGKVLPIKEELLNTVTGISGSAPAYFYLFMKSIIDSGIKNGLDEETAKELVVNTLIGSGKMVLSNFDKSISDLITAVCSKGGTTIEAMNVFEEEKLSETVDKAVLACINKSKELESL